MATDRHGHRDGWWGMRRARPWLLAAALFGAALAPGAVSAAAFPGERSEWQGAACYTFPVEGRPCRVIVPKAPLDGNPWVLRAEPVPAGPTVDIALLGKGFHIVTVESSDVLGSPRAVAEWDAVYALVTGSHALAQKAAVEGFGEGALLAYAWAAAHPDRVACVYADAPVTDWAAWLGGAGDPAERRTRLDAARQAFGLASDQAALDADRGALAQVQPIADAKIPILHVCGEKDAVTPLKMHTEPLQRRYWEAHGGVFDVIKKPKAGHEFGLDDPLAIVHFIMKYAGPKDPPSAEASTLAPWRVADYNRAGKVFVWGDVILLETGDDLTGVNWTGTFPKMNYEITVDAMRVAGHDFFCGLTVPYNESSCSLILGGWSGSTCGISCLDYNDAANNETTRLVDFQNGRWYRVRLRVMPDSIQAWIDGDDLLTAKTTGRTIDVRWEVEPSKPLGIATWRTTGAFRNFRIEPLPADAAAPAGR